jgi:5-methylcytosine-specific restriction protein A
MTWKRDSSSKRGYGWQWEKVRLRALKRDRYLCQPCERKGFVTQANAVDHILPKSQGGTDELENLQAICNECHEVKTIEESGGKRKPRIGLDGWPVGE